MTRPILGTRSPRSTGTHSIDHFHANPTSDAEWHCIQCNALLGLGYGSRLSCKYKGIQYFIDGGHDTVSAVCPKCSRLNQCGGAGDFRSLSVSEQ